MIKGIHLNNKAKIAEVVCDQCGKEFEKPAIKSLLNRQFHFCNPECRYEANRKGGILNKAIEKICLEKYGHISSAMNSEIIEKQKKTNLERWGHISSAMNPEIIEKQKETNLERYGARSPMLNPEIRQKSINTLKNNYGVENTMESPVLRERAKQTILENFGVEYVSQNIEIQNKIKETVKSRYGVDHTFQKDSPIRKKAEQTILERYGVINPFQYGVIRDKIDYVKASKKAHETLKQNGNYKNQSSEVEKRFISFLQDQFGHDDIEEYKLENDYTIDVWIKSLNLYIQLDGVYWHGLTRPIEEIKNSSTPRDKVIYGTWCRDQRQNQWFKENNLKLLRITDEEFIEAEENKDFQKIIEKIKNFIPSL